MCLSVVLENTLVSLCHEYFIKIMMIFICVQQHGIKYIFTLVGGHISPILVACEKLGLRVVDTRHEVGSPFQCSLSLGVITFI